MLRVDHYSDNLNDSGRSNDSTRGLDDLYSLDRYEEGDVSLEDEVISTMNEGRKLIYGCLFRFIVLIPLFFIFYTFYRGMVFLIDVYYHNHTLERFLDRVHEKIDDRHLPFISKLSDFMFYIFVTILMLRFVLFYPVIFNVQVLVRFASIYIFTYLIRGLIIIFTTIPSPYPYCIPLTKSETWWQTYATMMFGGRGKTECTGLLFSGRAFIIFLGLIILSQNSGAFFTLIMTVYSVLVTATIVATKFHYTVDVMFSLLFAGTFYYFYYSRIDSFGVQFLNKINTRKYSDDEELRYSILEQSVINKWFASLEQIPKLLSVGYKIKLLQPLVFGNNNIHEGVYREFKTMVYFFGIRDCDDLLSLYRGTKSFNFSYWKKIKIFRKKRKSPISVIN